METIKEVRQDIKSKLEAINKDDSMVENGLKLAFAPSCGRYRVELTGKTNKVFFAHNLREYKLYLYNFHSLLWIVRYQKKGLLDKSTIIALLDNCGFYYSH